MPGSFDALHSSDTFPTDGNAYGIPSVPHAALSLTPVWLAPYRTRIRAQDSTAGGAVHFFLDDYRFESVWGHPHKALRYLTDFRTLLTPDFSVYADWPLTLRLWNVYRSRWCGAWWVGLGFQVVPTLAWGGRESFAFCFAGVARQSVIAVSTLGIRADDKRGFEVGYREMLERLMPSRVLCYGELPNHLRDLADVRCYPTRCESITKARQHGR